MRTTTDVGILVLAAGMLLCCCNESAPRGDAAGTDPDLSTPRDTGNGTDAAIDPDAATGSDSGSGPDAGPGPDSGPITTGIIDPDRRMDWSRGNVGVPGGIPNRTTIFVNVATTTDPSYRCVGDGATDNSTALQNAINDCPAGQVVYVPAGTYRLNSQVVGSSTSNLTLRGDGMGQTIFMPHSTGGYGVFAFGSSDWPRPTAGQAITGGATTGSTTVTVASTQAVEIGKLVRIDPVNPSWVHNLNGEDNNPTMSFMFRVTAKTPTTVTFTPALPFDLSAMSPKLVPYSNPLVEGIGVEDLTVDLANTDTAAFSLEQAWGCWFKRVEITSSDARQMFLIAVSRSEVRECYTHGTRSGGPNHEGIDFYNDSCWNLVEDNIVYNGGFPGIILGDSKGGCQGNVIAYNYCGGVDVGSSDTTGADISFSHGPHNMLNLAEGNVVGMIQADGYFGSSSHNTLYRNAVTVTHPTATSGLRAVALHHYNTYYNVVGNVLGTPAFPQSPNGEYSTEVNGYSGQLQLIYQLGYPNMGNSGYSGTIGPTTPPDYTAEPFMLSAAQALDYNVKATLLRHGNYDYFNKATVWDSNIADHTLPPSFIYASKPAWFGNVPWPPIGPDVAGLFHKIPAQLRYEAGTP